MNISLKTPEEIQIMHQGGKMLSSILKKLFLSVKPGVNLLEIEKKAMALIKKTGGQAGFAMVPNYHWATCININEGIVHGVPKDYLIKPADVINIDIGLFYRGFHTDMSSTVLVKDKQFKNLSKKEFNSRKRFLEIGKKALKQAVKAAKSGRRVGHISQKIQKIIEKEGFSCARTLTGHGIGKKLHEPPSIPCFLKGKIKDTPILKPGMAIAVEVIYAQGKPDLIVDSKDKWTIKTKDGKISAVFEQTIAITKKGTIVLTRLPF